MRSSTKDDASFGIAGDDGRDTMPESIAQQDAERLLRRVWGVPGEPGFRLPVDPIRIARQLGIEVYTNRLGDNIAAVLAKEPGQDPVIVLNAGDSKNRQRFSCAHELGHYVRRTNAAAIDPVTFDTNDYEYTDYRSSLSSTGKDYDEVYANGFAAALLMPEAEITKRLHTSPVDLALTFDVSQEAIQVRLSSLRLAHG
jgi:Zn-dependent peptidase ImmA (M78 family)